MEYNINKFEKQFNYLIQNLDQHLFDQYKVEPKELPQFRLINNHDFYKDMNVINFLRDVGVHFRLGSMISRDSV